MKNNYKIAKNLFVDSVDVADYIELENSTLVYTQLEMSLEKPIKMILLFGRPGTGKSILLNTLAQNLKYQKEIHYFDTPSNEEKEFFSKFFYILTKKELPENSDINFSALVEYCQTLRDKREIIILLDEAQMYSNEMMEKIRLLSDTRVIKFIISLHKTEDEDLIAKEHFKSRIWETIELENVNLDNQMVYIHKKLLKENLFEIADSLSNQSMKLIYRFTEGNYRECNKLMYTIFDICDYYYNNEPKKINTAMLSRRIIEMAALKLGYIHA